VATACAATVIAAAGATSALAAPGTPAPSTGGAAPAPTWLAGAAKTGPMAGSSKLDLTVVLNGHNDAAAEAAAAAVSSPSSASYHNYVSSAGYRQQYSATNAEVATVTGWLKGAGFTVTSVPDNHLWVKVSGTADAAKKAFGTGLDEYTASGRKLHAPSGAVTLPASVKSLVDGVSGLTSSTRVNRPFKSDPGDLGDLARNRQGAAGGQASIAPGERKAAPPPDAFVNAPPCSTYWGQKLALSVPAPIPGQIQPYAPCGYVPSQIRGAYGMSNIGVNGAGTTVAIVDAYAAPTILSDANTYATKHGGKPFAAGQFSQITPPAFQYGYDDAVNGDVCGEQGWYGEETLDVEAVHGVAPGAKVLYVAGASCFDNDLLDALNTIIDGHKADIISNSWGDLGDIDPNADPALFRAYQRTFIQAALTGIGVFFSSGDNGDETQNPDNPGGARLADFPATSPWVTAVGGTSIGIGAKNDYLFEEAWGTGTSKLINGTWTPPPPGDYLYGGGGGVSKVFGQPFYQKGIVPAKISQYFGGKPGRAVPDVAALGDPQTGMLVGETQTFPNGTVKYSEYRIGGTSLSCPVTAGIEALADQAAGYHHGFANPAIYQLYGTRGVKDITIGKYKGVVRVNYNNNVDASGGTTTLFRSFQQFATLTSAKGYDDTTGVGTPNGFLYVYGLGQNSANVAASAAAQAG
jgi:subtilase family serine protease